jgi:ankyrin repeat protein
MYTRILNDIADGDERAQNVSLECFRWILYAKQPLSMEVLRVAVALLKSPRTTQELMSRRPPGEYIFEECRNLVRLSKHEFTNESITPIHFSFLEYLQNLPMDELRGDLWKSLKDSRDSESVLACSCIDWLLLTLPDNWGRSDIWASYMQLSYPTKFFDKHAKSAINGCCEAPANLLRSVNRLLSTNIGKIASLVKLRLMRMPLGKAREGRDFDEALAQNYLLWTSDLYHIPGLDSRWMELGVPKHALHLAVWFRPEELQRLLSNGHCVDELDACQQTSLAYACEKGCLTSVEVLLHAGAKLDADCWQRSPLGLAIQNDHVELTKMLLKAEASICILPDAEGHVPLMLATSLRMVELLCETYDFKLDATDRVGRSILGCYVGFQPPRYVAPAEATRILEYLINRGADMYAKSKARMTLVDYAACRDDGVESIKLLLQLDSKLTEKENHEWTPLHWACREGHPRTANTLLEHGSEAKKITTLQPPRSWTPYDIYVHYGQDNRSLDETLLHTLGRPEEMVIVAAQSSEEPIEYSSLEVTELPRHVKCSLCTMSVYVRNSVPIPVLVFSRSMLTHRRWDSCFTAKCAEARFALCAIILCTTIIPIMYSGLTTSSGFVWTNWPHQLQEEELIVQH